MTIQDYLMQQVPNKAKADMMFKQGDYNAAAEHIKDFAFGCMDAEETFGKGNPQADKIAAIGLNSASLMFAQILERTAKNIEHPADNNPYNDEDISLDSNVPELVRINGFDIAFMAASYSDFVMQEELSVLNVMGLLTSLSQLCSIGFYFNHFKSDDIDSTLGILRNANSHSDILLQKYPNEEQVKNVVKNFYIMAGLFIQHYASVCGDYDKMIDYKLEGLEFQQKGFSM